MSKTQINEDMINKKNSNILNLTRVAQILLSEH